MTFRFFGGTGGAPYAGVIGGYTVGGGIAARIWFCGPFGCPPPGQTGALRSGGGGGAG